MNRNLVIIIVAVLVLGCGVVALAGAVGLFVFGWLAPLSTSGGPGSPSITEELNQSFDVETPARLVVEQSNGVIRIVGGAEGTVEVRATKRASGPRATELLQSIQVETRQEGNTVRVSTRQAPGFTGIGNRSVDYEIRVPGQTEVEVSSANGEVSIEGVAGRISAVTHNGRIGVSGAQGQLEVRTSNGAIDIRDARVSQLTARTDNGAIDFAGSLGDGGDSQVETSNGRIRVVLSPEDRLRIDASSGNGSIDSSLSLENESKTRRSLSGLLNGGGPVLTLKTNNGSITLEAR